MFVYIKMRFIKRQIIYWIPVYLYMGVIFYFSSRSYIPVSLVATSGAPSVSYLQHAFLFFVLGLFSLMLLGLEELSRLAFLDRDYHKVATLHIECGWVPKTARVEQFEAAIRSVCEPIFNRPLKDISLEIDCFLLIPDTEI